MQYRAAIRVALDALVRGERPELLTWVQSYGGSGTTLVDQPEEIWTHQESDHFLRNDGSVNVLLPVWTADESPSDLTADIRIDANGTAAI